MIWRKEAWHVGAEAVALCQYFPGPAAGQEGIAAGLPPGRLAGNGQFARRIHFHVNLIGCFGVDSLPMPPVIVFTGARPAVYLCLTPSLPQPAVCKVGASTKDRFHGSFENNEAMEDAFCPVPDAGRSRATASRHRPGSRKRLY
ncbi:MAG TPA: hypothetical protein VF450_01885 [Noviherbaspirillum sp.]